MEARCERELNKLASKAGQGVVSHEHGKRIMTLGRQIIFPQNLDDMAVNCVYHFHYECMCF